MTRFTRLESVPNLAGKRIGLVGPLPPPAGGMANQTVQLAELLQGIGAKVSLVQTNSPYQPAWIAKVRGLRAAFRLIPYVFRLLGAVREADVIHVMANSGWSWHLFAAPAVWVCAVLGRPVVVNYRGGEADEFLRRSAVWVRWTMQRTSSLIVPSGFLKGIFERHGMDAHIVPNVVNLDRFSPGAVDLRHRRNILVTRNLEHIYGIDIALRAFAGIASRHPEHWLVIAGTGPADAHLKALARELGIEARVRFTGKLTPQEVACELDAAAISLNPSRVDNTPNSVLEAMASGVPVVSSRVGGVPFIVQDGASALLFPVDDAPTCSERLDRLLSDPVLAKSLSTQALVDVQRYRWSSVLPVLAPHYAARS